MADNPAKVNPFPPSSAIGVLFDFMKDERYHFKSELQELLNRSNCGDVQLMGRIEVMKKHGLTPVPPSFPMGRWNVRKQRGQVQLMFNQPVQGGGSGMDEEQVKELILKSADEGLKPLIEKFTLQLQQKLEKQIKQLQESSIPILEVHRFEGTKKIKSVVQPAHMQMENLLYLLNKGHHVYLYGDPGVGEIDSGSAIG